MSTVRPISRDTCSVIFGVAYVCLATNLLLVLSCLPVVLLLITTDPARSWPLLAAAAPLCAPGIAAAFTVFRDHAEGSTEVLRSFVDGWRACAGRALRLGAMASGLLVVLLVDVRVLAGSSAGVVLVPALGVLTVISVVVCTVGLVAVAEVPRARLSPVIKVSAYLALRRWYLTLVSLTVLGVQAAVFASLPAIALGFTAAPALYVAWANGRHLLRPALETTTAHA